MVNYFCRGESKEEKTTPEKKELLRMNCWEIASSIAFKYHRPDDPADAPGTFSEVACSSPRVEAR